MNDAEARKLIRLDIEEKWLPHKSALHQQTSHPHRVTHQAGGSKLHGDTEHLQDLAKYWDAFSDLHFRIEHLVVEGNMAAARIIGTGKHTGSLMGEPPTGKEITLSPHMFFRFEGDKIAEAWAEFDRLSLMEQLGMMPKKG